MCNHDSFVLADFRDVSKGITYDIDVYLESDGQQPTTAATAAAATATTEPEGGERGRTQPHQ
jgi:hypothetical protein